MRITVLGSGTSTGIPIPGCTCEVCTSTDPRNTRFRTSALVELIKGENTHNILFDTTPDLRAQALKFGFSRIDSVLYTHTHADHVCGIDDLRSFNFVNKMRIPVYANEDSSEHLLRMFSYAFKPDPNYEGGAPPQLDLKKITPYEPIELLDTSVIPLPIYHGKMEILGFRIGGFAYLTDCSAIPERTAGYLRDLDVLIIDGLRDRPHNTHFTQEEAVAEIVKLKPKKSYLIHMSHEVEHIRANAKLREFSNLDIELAYDGLVIEL